MFPNNPDKYKALMLKLAENHPDIQASDENGRFMTIARSSIPFSSWDIKEFNDMQNSKLKTSVGGEHKLFMAMIQMDEDNQGESLSPAHVNGGFILLRKTTRGNYSERDKAYNDAYNTGKNIMSWLEKYFSLNNNKGVLKINNCNNEPIGPVDPGHMYGWAFNFSYLNRQTFCVKEDAWGDFLPIRDIEEVENDND